MNEFHPICLMSQWFSLHWIFVQVHTPPIPWCCLFMHVYLSGFLITFAINGSLKTPKMKASVAHASVRGNLQEMSLQFSVSTGN